MLFFDLRLALASAEEVRASVKIVTISRIRVKFILILVRCPGPGSELSKVV